MKIDVKIIEALRGLVKDAVMLAVTLGTLFHSCKTSARIEQTEKDIQEEFQFYEGKVK